MQQAFTCANVDPDLYHHMASLDHSELTPVQLNHNLNSMVVYLNLP